MKYIPAIGESFIIDGVPHFSDTVFLRIKDEDGMGCSGLEPTLPDTSVYAVRISENNREWMDSRVIYIQTDGVESKQVDVTLIEI